MRLSENLLAKYFQNSGRSRRVIRENVHEMVLFTVDSLEKKNLVEKLWKCDNSTAKICSH